MSQQQLMIYSRESVTKCVTLIDDTLNNDRSTIADLKEALEIAHATVIRLNQNLTAVEDILEILSQFNDLKPVIEQELKNKQLIDDDPEDTN